MEHCFGFSHCRLLFCLDICCVALRRLMCFMRRLPQAWVYLPQVKLGASFWGLSKGNFMRFEKMHEMMKNDKKKPQLQECKCEWGECLLLSLIKLSYTKIQSYIYNFLFCLRVSAQMTYMVVVQPFCNIRPTYRTPFLFAFIFVV